jgi:hypothetical protein
MSALKKLALIAVGYALAVAGGVAVVAVHELFVPDNSGGMAAFGDIILFVLVAGFLSLAPTWFLLKLSAEKAPRSLAAILLLIVAIGPLSWLAVVYLAADRVPNQPQATNQLLGLLIAFCAMPRIIAGPVILLVEGVAFLLARDRMSRTLLAAAMLMDLVPLGIFALHLAGVGRH